MTPHMLQYQYRPGTFTGWIANKLAKHAKKRRSELRHVVAGGAQEWKEFLLWQG